MKRPAIGFELISAALLMLAGWSLLLNDLPGTGLITVATLMGALTLVVNRRPLQRALVRVAQGDTRTGRD